MKNIKPKKKKQNRTAVKEEEPEIAQTSGLEIPQEPQKQNNNINIKRSSRQQQFILTLLKEQQQQIPQKQLQ